LSILKDFGVPEVGSLNFQMLQTADRSNRTLAKDHWSRAVMPNGTPTIMILNTGEYVHIIHRQPRGTFSVKMRSPSSSVLATLNFVSGLVVGRAFAQ
jgi:hypothetical protein